MPFSLHNNIMQKNIHSKILYVISHICVCTAIGSTDTPIQFYIEKWSPEITEIYSISLEVFSRKSVLRAHFKGPYSLTRFFIFTGHRPITYKIIKYRIQIKSVQPFGRAHRYIYTYTYGETGAYSTDYCFVFRSF
jgi:hypothetical protein